MASKNQSKKTASRKSKENSNLPKGFKAIQGFSKSHDFDENPVLQGIWGEVREIEVKPTNKNDDGKRTVVEVTPANGIPVTVWRSAGLAGLFDQAEEGDEVYIEFTGMGKAKKGQSAPRLFVTGIK